MNALNGAVAIPDPRSTTYGSLPASLRGGPLPAGKPSVIGGRPGPRAPVLRAVPGLASLPFVLATLAFSPASGRGAFCACARAWSSPQGGAGCPARAWRSGASCARLGLASPPQPVPCALAPSGPAAWGVGLWAVLLVLLRGSCRAFRRSCGGSVGFLGRCLGLGVCRVRFCFCAVAVVCGSFRPRFVRALGWVCAGCVVPPVRPRRVRLRGRGAVFVRRGCWPVCPFLGLSLAARVSRLRGAPGSGRVCGFRPGCAVLPGRAWSGVPFAGVAVRRVLSCGRLVVPSLSLLPSSAPAVVGFSGGRRLPAAFRPLVSGVVGAVLSGGRSVAVGCAGGADAFVRAAAPGAVVFSAAAFGSGRASFARRSAALVASVAAGGPGSGLVVFPSAPCPAGLLPSPRSSACFCGLGSGSWASAAFAAGLGLPVVVFPCGFSALPPWCAWRPLSGAWSGGFLFC